MSAAFGLSNQAAGSPSAGSRFRAPIQPQAGLVFGVTRRRFPQGAPWFGSEPGARGMVTQSDLDKLVAVFGGSGFLGRHVVRALCKRGYRVRVPVRRADLPAHPQPL